VHAGRPRRASSVASLVGSVVLVVLAASALPPTGGAALAGDHPSSVRANGSPPSTPYIQHVVVVVLENEVLSNVWGHGPYERYLAAQFGNATQYYAVCHPSAPNYLVMFAAVANQCGSDSWYNYTNASINEELDGANLSWGAYAESLPSGACSDPGSATAGLFATRHVPALWFSNVLQNQTYCADHVLPSDSFNQSIANGTLRNYSFYTPNLCDDGHNGCGGNTTDAQETAQADTWLDGWLSPILNHTGRYASSAEQAVVNHTAFFLTWDEGTGSNAGYAVPGITGGDNYKWCGQNGASGDAVCGGQIYTAVVSPYSRHTSFATNDSSYGLLRTVEWLFDLPALGNPGGFDNQTGFPAMTSLFQFPGSGYPVTVNESGLPPNSPWTFQINGVPPSSTNGTNLTVAMPNGSYDFVATTSLPDWSSPNGSFVVNGSPVSVPLSFVAEKFPVTFVESGLPNGSWWRLNVSGVAPTAGNASSVVVHLTDGTRTYVATTNDSTWTSPNGSFVVSGGPRTVNVTFAPVTFLATVTEMGLPATTPWWLNVSDGPQAEGTGTHLSVALPNGTYSFSAQAGGDVWTRDAGALDVLGGPTGTTVDFARVVFNVTFSAANLAPGAEWNLSFGGTNRTLSGAGATSFLETNGTYAFAATGPANAPALEPNGTVPVAGGPANVTIRFDPALSIEGFSPPPGAAVVGRLVAIPATIVGGTSPWAIRYGPLPAGCSPADGPGLFCLPSESGNYSLVIEVTDAVGAKASATTTLVVEAPPSVGGTPSHPTGPNWSIEVGVVAVVAAGVILAGALVGRRRRPPE
jgi:hypothetical protein